MSGTLTITAGTSDIMTSFNTSETTNTIIYPDGAKVVVTYVSAPTVVTPPIAFPAGANLVTIGSQSYPLDAIDPPTTDPTQPGGRGQDKLIIITNPNTATRNQWGYEVQVIDNTTGTNSVHQIVPVRGYLLSGNGKAATFLQRAASGGPAPVVVSVAPAGGSGGSPGGSQGNSGGSGGSSAPPTTSYLSTYWMIYNDSPAVHATSIPTTVNEVRPAFFVSSGVLTGLSPFGQSTMANELQLLQKRGVKICPSIGGGGNSIDISNAVTFASRWSGLPSKLGVTPDGINIDIETDFNNSQLIGVLQQLRTTYGKNFRISWSPNGTYIDQYLALAVQHPDLVDEFGQQFYDASMSWTDIDDRLSQAKSAGLLMSKYSLGLMIGPNPNYETVNDCVRYMGLAKAKYGINKAYWWELSRTGTTDAINQVAALYT